MFGMGFTEILLIAVVAILFLGPDKLPDAMVSIAKFIKGAKEMISEAKTSLAEEVNIEDLKKEALSYKAKLDEATEELQGFKNINPMEQLNEEMNSVKENFEAITQKPTETTTTQVEPKQKEISFKKKSIKESTLKEVKDENGGDNN